MGEIRRESGFATSGNARIYYEAAGQGIPFVMLHAGVANSRMWDNEFEYFSRQFRVVRFDLRGYGKSEPEEGEFRHIQNLKAVLDELQVEQPAILMGCSMGGGLAMDYALEEPAKVKALIMVGSAPMGLELDVSESPKFAEAEKAFEAGDLDRVAEIETQIWFDGEGRTPQQVNQEMRRKLYEMNRLALEYEARGLGKRLPDAETPAAGRLSELEIPVLVIVGLNDSEYLRRAAVVMVKNRPEARKVMLEEAAQLPNMDHPQEFRRAVETFLEAVM